MKSFEFIKVYDLKNNNHYMEDIQNATLKSDKFGLKITNGLFGSNEWWEAIDRGSIKKYTVEGVITKIFMSGDLPPNKWTL